MIKLALAMLAVTTGLVMPLEASAVATEKVEITTYITPMDAPAAEERFLALLGSAQKTILMNAYGFTDPAVADALVAAKKRGVDVKVIFDATEAAGPHQAPLIEQLVDAGVETHIGKSPVNRQLLHAKFTVVDYDWTEDGSWNYSPSASQQFNDLNFVKDKKRAAQFTEAWLYIQNKIAEHDEKKKAHQKDQ